MSPRIANSTHFGIGYAPDSHRATVARDMPRAVARPDCVSPASVRSAMRVSGCTGFTVPEWKRGPKPPLVSWPAVPALAMPDVPVSIDVELAVSNFGPAALANFFSHFGPPCFGRDNVAPRYTTGNNLYQTRWASHARATLEGKD